MTLSAEKSLREIAVMLAGNGANGVSSSEHALAVIQAAIANITAGNPVVDASAGGDLAGTYPNPALIASGVTAGTYGDSTHVPQVAIDDKGRVTSALNVAIDAAPSGGGAGGVQVATVTLSSAQLLDLHNTPVELVAAPGAGQAVLPISVVLYAHYGTTPYSGVDCQFTVGYGAPGAQSPVLTLTDYSVSAQAADVVQFAPLVANIDASAPIVGQSLRLGLIGGVLTGGDGTLDVIVTSITVDVPA